MDDIQSLIEELRFGAENGADAELLERAADKIQELVADLGDADAMTEYWMKKNKWIRCEDRLPEDQERILFTTDYFVAGHKITVAGRFDSKGNRFIPIEEAPQDEYLTCEIECWTPYPDSSKCKSGWIKCSERLPYDDQMVLVPIIDKDIPGTEILICRYIKCERPMFRHYGFRGIKDFTGVTHWMPLPDAPEVEG